MIPAFLFILATAQLTGAANTDGLGASSLIMATVGHSEWCPAGDVRLELGSGRYLLTPRAPRATCNDPGLKRPTRRGALARPDLDRLRAAALRAQTEGMLNPDCRDGGKPQELVISNGGAPRLVLSTERGLFWASENLGCWSKAGRDLHKVLDEVLGANDWR